ncbi:MAG: hypothetical protein U0529_19950 [Thermoanaerobaculia bacterium]
MPDFPTLSDLGGDDPSAQAPAENRSSAPPSRARQILDWLAGEGFRCDVDDDGDIHLRHEGRDVFVLLDADDPAYVRFLVPDVWKCDDDSAERSVALVVANTLNSSLKALKVSLRSNGSVYATVELFLDGFDAFRNVAPRCLDLLGAATWEFRSRMREARQKADDEEAAGRALAEAGADDDGEQP